MIHTRVRIIRIRVLMIHTRVLIIQLRALMLHTRVRIIRIEVLMIVIIARALNIQRKVRRIAISGITGGREPLAVRRTLHAPHRWLQQTPR